MSQAVLVINSGSSSVKFALIDPKQTSVHLAGVADSLGLEAPRLKWNYGGQSQEKTLPAGAEHAEVLTSLVNELLNHPDYPLPAIGCIGHRVVHGGEKFQASVLITQPVIEQIRDCIPLAPLHNPAHLLGIEAAMQAFPDLPNVAVFDTAFHQTLPEEAYLYALPYSLYREQGVRRYGMHGTSHRFIAQAAADHLGQPLEQTNIISCHLGNGSSLCAIRQGQSVDTSMGMTPLEGLVMGTRSGDLDPAILFHLHEQLGYDWDELNRLLTQESGLLGLTESTSDFRPIEAERDTNPAYQRAFQVSVHRLAKYIAGYTSLMDGRLDAICFTGGIGENSAALRQAVCERLGFLQIVADSQVNQQLVRGKSGNFALPSSAAQLLVLPTDEEGMIARDAAAIALTN